MEHWVIKTNILSKNPTIENVEMSFDDLCDLMRKKRLERGDYILCISKRNLLWIDNDGGQIFVSHKFED